MKKIKFNKEKFKDNARRDIGMFVAFTCAIGIGIAGVEYSQNKVAENTIKNTSVASDVVQAETQNASEVPVVATENTTPSTAEITPKPPSTQNTNVTPTVKVAENNIPVSSNTSTAPIQTSSANVETPAPTPAPKPTVKYPKEETPFQKIMKTAKPANEEFNLIVGRTEGRMLEPIPFTVTGLTVPSNVLYHVDMNGKEFISLSTPDFARESTFNGNVYLQPTNNAVFPINFKCYIFVKINEIFYYKTFDYIATSK